MGVPNDRRETPDREKGEDEMVCQWDCYFQKIYPIHSAVSNNEYIHHVGNSSRYPHMTLSHLCRHDTCA